MTNLKLVYDNKVSDIPLNYIDEYVEAYLNSKSKATAINYRPDMKQFINFIFKKESKLVTVTDIERTNSLDATNFFIYLKDEIITKNKDEDGNPIPGLKNASVKRKITAVKGFYKFLRVDFPNINPFIFDNLNLESEELDEKGYGNLEWEEAIEMWDYAEEHYRKENYQLTSLIKLASVTSIRLEALLSLTWEDHFYQSKRHGDLVNYIQVQDKKQIHKKSISEPLYNELKERLGDTGKLFYSLHKHKVGIYIKEIIEALGYDQKRILRFHSLKKAGVNRVLELTGDLQKAKEQGNHKSLTTTEKHYLVLKEDLTQMASYTLDQSIDAVKEIEVYSKEEITNALKHVSDSAKFELLRILQGS